MCKYMTIPTTYQETEINAGKETNSHQRLISKQSGPDGHFDEVC